MKANSTIRISIMTAFLAIGLAIGPLCIAKTKALPVNLDQVGTIADLAMLQSALAINSEYSGNLTEIGKSWRKIDSIKDTLNPNIMKNAPSVDRWGNTLLVRIAWKDFYLLSLGPNGKLDDREQMETIFAERHGIRDRLKSLRGDDLIFSDGEVVKGPISTEDRWKKTMGGIRILATAAAAFSIDNGYYPTKQPGLIDATAIAEHLSPDYLRNAPEIDSFGYPFKILGSRDYFMVISYGADGKPDIDYTQVALDNSSWGNPGFSDPNSDIVHFNGVFVSYPAGTSRR